MIRKQTFYNLVIFSIKSDQDHTFVGDRIKEDIVNFALRMSGPPVQQVTKMESMDNLKTHNALFFMYVGPQDGHLWDIYNQVAEQFQPHGFFYAASTEIAKRHVDIDDFPAVLVYKESMHYFFSGKQFYLIHLLLLLVNYEYGTFRKCIFNLRN